MKAILLFAALIFQCEVFTLSESSINGSVSDTKSNEVLPFSNVVLYQKGVQVMGTTTDINGKYELKGILEGEYELSFSFLGYTSKTIEVEIKNAPLKLDASLKKGIYLKEVVIECEQPELIIAHCYTGCGGFHHIIEKREITEDEKTIKKNSEPQLQLFPNPSTGENVSINYNNYLATTNGEITVRLVDILGKGIASKKIVLENGVAQFQLKELEEVTPGQYFVSLVDGNKRLSKKIIIQ